MKAILMGLVVMMAASTAMADEFVAGIKEEAPQAVDVFPHENDAVSIGLDGASLTIRSFTSWCGEVVLTARPGSLEAAHELHRKLIAQTNGIPGEVKNIRKLILSVENGVLKCRVDSNQSFVFEFTGVQLKGEGLPRITAQGTGAQCEALIKNF